MKKLKIEATSSITFKEGCEKYLEDCMQRNLRDGSLICCLNKCNI